MGLIQTIKKVWPVVAAMGGVGGGVLSYASFMHDSGGVLAATMNGENLANNVTKEVVIFLESPDVASSLSALHPTFSNSSSYSIRDFALQYKFSSSSVQFEPTDYYRLYNDGPGEYTLKYDESVLPGSKSVENPIRKIVVAENGGDLTMRAEATYDGCSEPYVYTLNALYKVVPNSSHLDYEQWKQSCQRSYTKALSIPNFYITDNGKVEYVNSVDIASTVPEPKKQSPQTPKPKKTVESKDETTAKAKAVPQHPLAPLPGKAIGSTPATTPEKSTAEPIVKKSNNNLSDFLLSVTQTDEPVSSIEFKVSAQYPDSMIAICFKITDENDKEFNTVYPIRGYRNENTIKTSEPVGYKIIDYALCEENPVLRDSVKVDGGELKNLTRHAIAIASANPNKFFSTIIGPKKTRIFIDDVNLDTCNLKFYDVPASVLAEDNLPLELWPDRETIVTVAIIGFSIALLILPLAFIVLVIVNISEGSFGEIKSDFEEVKKDLKSPGNYVKFLLFAIGITSLVVICTILSSVHAYYF